MDKKIIELCEQSYCKEDYNYHILPVVKNALLLAKTLNADIEVVETAAYLHDIGRAVAWESFEIENNHHEAGAIESQKILKKLGYGKDFIEKVRHCVLSHRGRTGPEPKTLEAKIIACADAMTHFDTFLDLFCFFVKTTKSFEEALIKIDEKIDRDWNIKLSLPEAKEIVREKHEAIKLLIKSNKEFLQQK